MHVFMCWRLSERRAPPARPGISVDVYIPTYSEPIDLVRKTALGGNGDGLSTSHLDSRCMGAGKRCELWRPSSDVSIWRVLIMRIAKAGNLNHALAGTSAS